MSSASPPIAARDTAIRLTLPARPENVAVVRHVLGALAEALDLERTMVVDMRLAVTEACTNVVRHAYGSEEGTIDVVVRPLGDMLEVVVTDAGRGLGPSPDTAGPGLGLALIEALTHTFEIQRPEHEGSRLVMGFARRTPSIGMT